MKRTTRMNGGNDICRSVEKSLEEYFRKLDGEQPHSIYDMVIANVERSLLASVMHRAGVERSWNVPNLAGEQGRSGATVENTIAIGAAGRREPGVPTLRCADGPQHHHGRWFHMEVQRVANRLRRDDVGQLQLCDLPLGVHACVGAPGHDRCNRLAAIEFGGGVLQHLLHREPGCLTLPADKWRAVVFQQKRPARHL